MASLFGRHTTSSHVNLFQSDKPPKTLGGGRGVGGEGVGGGRRRGGGGVGGLGGGEGGGEGGWGGAGKGGREGRRRGGGEVGGCGDVVVQLLSRDSH